jgi:folate-dependent phosphoribosylglycinamide formyltransferase PurN
MHLDVLQYASTVLDELMEQATQPDAEFHVSAVVTRPLQPVLHPAGQGGVGSARAASTLPPSPVEQAAHRWGLHPSCILRPHTAKDSAFLEHLESLRPDVCVTAAYGCILPQRFLDIPRLGTLNIHPSLLPKYVFTEAHGMALYSACFFLNGSTYHMQCSGAHPLPVIAQVQRCCPCSAGTAGGVQSHRCHACVHSPAV